MTDEEIEKALEWCQYKGFYFCDECPVEQKYKDEGFCTAVLTTRAFDYIDRLKDEIAGLTGAVEALKTDNENLNRILGETNDELETVVRKDTAKRILKEFSELCNGQGGVCYDVDIKAIAEKYGIEVKE